MKVVDLEFTPIFIPYKNPYHWAQGITEGAELILVKLRTDKGIEGYGESIATPSSKAILSFLDQAKKLIIGRDIYENDRIFKDVYQYLFQAHGTCSAPRFASQVLCGIEIAFWDAKGKEFGKPVYQLLGGKQHEALQYFGFAQGESANEIAKDAKELAQSGYKVIYIKVGKKNEEEDIEIIKKTRLAIGKNRRLRIDPNEHWPILKMRRLIERVKDYNIEFIEQPCDAESLIALSHAQQKSLIPIAADQSVFTIHDAFNICKINAADMLTLGIHETGGISNFKKIAQLAEAAGINICIHGLYESGITSYASHQLGISIPNIDDGNQIMLRFLEWDIIRKGIEFPDKMEWPVNNKVGLGFDIDEDAVKEASKLHRKKRLY
jgi:L-alanine-DL-glutamate epimerase-like enolase superfamily enzyme